MRGVLPDFAFFFSRNLAIDGPMGRSGGIWGKDKLEAAR